MRAASSRQGGVAGSNARVQRTWRVQTQGLVHHPLQVAAFLEVVEGDAGSGLVVRAELGQDARAQLSIRAGVFGQHQEHPAQQGSSGVPGCHEHEEDLVAQLDWVCDLRRQRLQQIIFFLLVFLFFFFFFLALQRVLDQVVDEASQIRHSPTSLVRICQPVQTLQLGSLGHLHRRGMERLGEGHVVAGPIGRHASHLVLVGQGPRHGCQLRLEIRPE